MMGVEEDEVVFPKEGEEDGAGQISMAVWIRCAITQPTIFSREDEGGERRKR